MTNKKPDPVFKPVDSKVCPICHKKSYSKAGIHPQCASIKADEPRRLRLLEEKKSRELQTKLDAS